MDIGEIRDDTEKEDAALVVKKYWKGFIDRMKVIKLREEEQYFLGLKKPEEEKTNNDQDDLLSFMNRRKK